MTELEGLDQADRQTKLLLDTVLELTGAEAAALVPMQPGEAITSTGTRRLDEDQARAIIDVVESGEPSPISPSPRGRPMRPRGSGSRSTAA